jgi:hypothetical protein
MSRPEDRIPEELQELVAAACDGELSDRETEQLEELLLESADARRFYLLYVHLHGELHWHQAMAGQTPDLTNSSAEGKGKRIPTPVVARPKPDSASRLRLIGFCLFAGVAVTLLALAYRAMPDRKSPPSPAPPAVSTSARLTGAVRARWETGATPPATGQAIPLDRRFVLERGVIEITHGKDTQLLVEGPAAFRYMPGARIEFESGRATVIAGEEPDLLIDAGGRSIEPAEGAIGLSIDAGQAEIHSLGGKVQVRRVRAQEGTLEETEIELAGQDAIAWSTDSEEPPLPISANPGQFLLALPDRMPSHCVAKMREVVANHPRLTHQYSFEGTSRLEKCQDKRGVLHLTEAVMVDGRGRGSLDYMARGFDLTTEAIRPHREPIGGDEKGTALQSEVRYSPPKAMTIELLLRYQIPDDGNDETVALAVATRDGERDCGFYVAAVGRGHLSLLLDGEADWVEMNTILAAQHWYYLAVTFEAGEEDTIVNAYLVDLAGGNRKLQQILENEEVPAFRQ